MPLLAFSGKKPKVHKSAYIAKSATLIGDVTIGAKSSI
ncbi:MAG: gamma carbonic anhydrase family protein, partial [Thaumarchaeota archaeon]|nr:gamma carbonic anhydrase family protein [Nitrososphaerota archaeon]